MEILALIDLYYFILNDIKENISDEKLKMIKDNSAFMKIKRSRNFDIILMDYVLNFKNFIILLDKKLSESQNNYVNLYLDKFLEFLRSNN